MSVLQVVSSPPLAACPIKSKSAYQERRIEKTAYFEKMWLHYPQQFYISKTALGRNRLLRFKELISLGDLPESEKVCDLGCGEGAYSLWLSQKNVYIDAVDISNNCLKRLRENKLSNLRWIQDYIPHTRLRDSAYGLIICTDLIAELHPNEYRLLFSEIARLCKSDGKIICSTPVDFDSEDAVNIFLSLAETELTITHVNFAYDRLFIRLCDLFAWPRRVARACSQPLNRQKQVDKRKGLTKWLFKLASISKLLKIWMHISYLTNKIHRRIEDSDLLRKLLEKLSRYFWQENAISHVMFLADKRSLVSSFIAEKPKEIQEIKKRKAVWE